MRDENYIRLETSRPATSQEITFCQSVNNKLNYFPTYVKQMGGNFYVGYDVPTKMEIAELIEDAQSITEVSVFRKLTSAVKEFILDNYNFNEPTANAIAAVFLDDIKKDIKEMSGSDVVVELIEGINTLDTANRIKLFYSNFDAYSNASEWAEKFDNILLYLHPGRREMKTATRARSILLRTIEQPLYLKLKQVKGLGQFMADERYLSDIMQTALITADQLIFKFDAERNSDFIAWALGSAYFNDILHAVYVITNNGKTCSQNTIAVTRAKNLLLDRNEKVTMEKLQKMTGLSERALKNALALSSSETSCEEFYDDDREEYELPVNTESAEDTWMNDGEDKELSAAILNVLKKFLSKNQFIIAEARFTKADLHISNVEMAESFGISEDAYKSRLRQIRKKVADPKVIKALNNVSPGLGDEMLRMLAKLN